MSFPSGQRLVDLRRHPAHRGLRRGGAEIAVPLQRRQRFDGVDAPSRRWLRPRDDRPPREQTRRQSSGHFLPRPAAAHKQGPPKPLRLGTFADRGAPCPPRRADGQCSSVPPRPRLPGRAGGHRARRVGGFTAGSPPSPRHRARRPAGLSRLAGHPLQRPNARQQIVAAVAALRSRFHNRPGRDRGGVIKREPGAAPWGGACTARRTRRSRSRRPQGRRRGRTGPGSP